MASRIGVLFFVAGLIGPATAPAVAEQHWRSLDTARSVVFTDGSRYAAYALADGSTRVLDTVRGRAFRVPAAAGFVQAVGGGQLLLTSGPDVAHVPSVRLYDLRSRAIRVPAGFDEYRSKRAMDGAPGVIQFSRVGSVGIGGSYTDRGRGYAVRLNWHTGAVQEQFNAPDKPEIIEDLDRSELSRRLCSPLRQTTAADDTFFREPAVDPFTGEPYLRFSYDGRYGLAYLGPRGTRLGLWRCGQQRPLILSRTARRGSFASPEAQLGAGIASWVDNTARRRGDRSSYRGQATTYDIARRRRTRWPALTSFGGPVQASHTGSRIFAAAVPRPRAGKPPGLYTIKIAPIR